jgi:hypothetical protein
MSIKEKCDILINKGFKYDLKSGKIFNSFGKELKRKTNFGYLRINGSTHFKGGLFNHHFAWYYIYGNCDFDRLDHINRNRSDNRIDNLRILTNQENCWNTNAKGCRFRKDIKKWSSQICINYKQIHLGYFNTEEEARNTYLTAKEKYHKI